MGVLHGFLNCAHGTKLRNAPQISSSSCGTWGYSPFNYDEILTINFRDRVGRRSDFLWIYDSEVPQCSHMLYSE